MKVTRALCLMVLTLSFAIPVLADCTYPKKPADPPVGATATRDQMIAAKQVTTQYSDDVKSYLNCLDAEAASQITALGADAKPEQIEPIKNKRDLKYSAAEETMQKYVDSFNAELRAYKAAQSQPAK